MKKLILIFLFACCNFAYAQSPRFKVIGFFTGKNDQAHVSFVHEANKWLENQASKNHFQYDSTSVWENLNDDFLKNYQIVIFLDTRPENPSQRAAFERYMKNGGAWMGFHFSAFALTPSSYNQNWDWYHNEFLGSGEYGSNTWRPTSAILKVEQHQHPAMKKIPSTFVAQPNEWYRWKNDLTKNPDIMILASIDPSSFPLGTGPKSYEIWNSGYFPVVWTNKKYKMIYINMGHNDMDYEHKFNKFTTSLSSSFGSEPQNRLIINSLNWLGSKKDKKIKNL